jgi:hypothetical protein
MNMNMNPISLTAAQLGLQPAEHVNGSEFPPDSVLHGQLILAGCSFHVTAIQVSDVSGVWCPLHPDYTSEVEALYNMSGSDLTTATIEDKTYLLAIFPHGS